ncbi:MAG: hypothetical protein M3R04_10045, partial [bacterium]|nr:hypothetical protein [bacterium]
DTPWLQRHVMVDIAGVDVAITGVTQPELVSFEMPAGVNFSDPIAALDEILQQLKSSDFRIVCLEGDPTWIDQITQRYKDQADLFLSGNRREGADLDFHNDPPRLNSFDRGRYMGLITVDSAADGYALTGTNLPLNDELANDESVQKLLDETYKPQLKDKFFSTIKGNLKLYLPPDYCADCHKEAVEVYNRSLHSHALETLNKKGQTYNPDCMKCHVTYDATEDVLHSMNCVTCHTNITDDHVFQALEGADKVVKPETPITTYTYDWCYQCHDPLNSANFEAHWPQYVNKIYHGGDKTAAQAAAKALGIDMSQPPPAHE